MKKIPVIGIGLDSADPVLLERWMAQGYLPNLSNIRGRGLYGRLGTTVQHGGGTAPFSCTEPLWVMFSTGVKPNQSGFWDTASFSPQDYWVTCDQRRSGYDYQEYKPFYALGDAYKVAIFDLPVAKRCGGVNGIQVLGWGGHFPFVQSHSQPETLLPEIVQTYGENPVFLKDGGKWWNRQYIQWLQTAIQTSTTRRSQIAQDLLQRDQWDLFLTTFGDTHSAGHDLYDQSQPEHLLHPYRRNPGGDGADPLLKAYEQVDGAIGKILEACPEEAYVLCYSLHGMGANCTDQLSMFFLGEVLYRFNFPGQMALAPGKLGAAPPPPIKRPIRGAWSDEIWRKIYEPNPLKRWLTQLLPKKLWPSHKYGLASPKVLNLPGNDLGWMPATAYSPLWPQMRAFALPAFADGHIRINLKGRERAGIVKAADYGQLCDDLTAMLYRLTDGRSGQPLVKSVLRTRLADPLDADPKLPDADLVVVWQDCPTDIVESPELGRIGPVTLNRPGGHRARGFVMGMGPGLEAGQTIPEGQAVDLAPTILSLMQAPVPPHMAGKVLFKVKQPTPP